VSQGSARPAEELPEVDFSTFVLSLAHSVLVHLGVAAAPEGETVERNLPFARQTIDLLGMLAEKTKGNLTGAEEHLLEQLLIDVRSHYAAQAEKSVR
jgi:hypothetical protein